MADRGAASRLSANIIIKHRVPEIQSSISSSLSITVEMLIQELEDARQIALSAKIPQVNAAISAKLGKAKLLGFEAKQRNDDNKYKIEDINLLNYISDAELVRLESVLLSKIS